MYISVWDTIYELLSVKPSRRPVPAVPVMQNKLEYFKYGRRSKIYSCGQADPNVLGAYVIWLIL